jgi:carbon monoxide dehydrogenase subunit G
MTKQKVQAGVSVDNTPEAVMNYIADVRNRPLYLPSLKAIQDIKGSGTGTTWKWTWVIFGLEFQGTGRCLDYQPGKSYTFKTEGGLESTWTYQAAAEGNGTRLTIEVEYTVPERILPRLRSDPHKAEVEQVIQNLKTILDR